MSKIKTPLRARRARRARADPFALHRREVFTTDNRFLSVVGEYFQEIRASGKKFNKSEFFRDAIIVYCIHGLDTTTPHP